MSIKSHAREVGSLAAQGLYSDAYVTYCFRKGQMEKESIIMNFSQWQKIFMDNLVKDNDGCVCINRIKLK